jgi:hypothetical protein
MRTRNIVIAVVIALAILGLGIWGGKGFPNPFDASASSDSEQVASEASLSGVVEVSQEDVPYGKKILMDKEETPILTTTTVNGVKWYRLYFRLKTTAAEAEEVAAKEGAEIDKQIAKAQKDVTSIKGSTQEDLNSAESEVIARLTIGGIGEPGRWLYRGGPFTIEKYEIFVKNLRSGLVQLKNGAVGVIEKDGQMMLVSNDPHAISPVDVVVLDWESKVLDELNEVYMKGLQENWKRTRASSRVDDAEDIWRRNDKASNCITDRLRALAKRTTLDEEYGGK